MVIVAHGGCGAKYCSIVRIVLLRNNSNNSLPFYTIIVYFSMCFSDSFLIFWKKKRVFWLKNYLIVRRSGFKLVIGRKMSHRILRTVHIPLESSFDLNAW